MLQGETAPGCGCLYSKLLVFLNGSLAAGHLLRLLRALP